MKKMVKKTVVTPEWTLNALLALDDEDCKTLEIGKYFAKLLAPTIPFAEATEWMKYVIEGLVKKAPKLGTLSIGAVYIHLEEYLDECAEKAWKKDHEMFVATVEEVIEETKDSVRPE